MWGRNGGAKSLIFGGMCHFGYQEHAGPISRIGAIVDCPVTVSPLWVALYNIHHVRVARCHQVHILRMACLHLGPRRILPGNQLALLVLFSV